MIDRSTLRIALRTLGRHRGFATVAVLSLAVAIALNTVMYSALDAMIYPQIDARKPENVFSFWYFGNVRRFNRDQVENAIRAGARNFEALSGYQNNMYLRFWGMIPLAENGSRYKRVTPVTVRADFFDFLGTRPREGRTFRAADETEGNAPAVISDRLARHLFPDQSPVGKTVTLDGRGFAVIGVVRRNSTFAPLFGDMWVLRSDTAVVPANLIRFTKPIPQFNIDEELKQVAAQLALADNDPTKWTAFRGKAFKSKQFAISKFHWALIGAVGAVLLVACANLANLQLARGLSRTRELALRSAVGASRRQLITLLVLETALLALLGLALGVVLTLWGIKLVTASIPETINEYLVEPQTSWRVFAFATGAAITCLFLVGLIPAVRISRVDPNDLLKSGAGTGANREHRRRYGMMVVAQIGLALPVIIGAIVVLKATWKVNSAEFVTSRYGYDPRPIVSGRIPFARAAKRAMLADIAAELTSRARSVPGVLEVAVMDSREPVKRRVTVDDENGVIRDEPAPLWSYDVVSPSYFRTINQSIERGRDFIDGESDGKAVIMDAPSARFLWGNQNPIGRSIKFGDKDSNAPWHRVVGIARDMRDTATIRRVDYTTGFRLSNVYRVMTPADSVDINRWGYGSMSFYARMRGNTELAAVRLQRNFRNMRTADKPAVTPLTDQMGLAQARTQQNFVSSLFSTFALLGLGLVAFGVYGIVSHSVAERHRELAVRISLGATARDILHSVLREGNVLILAGVAIGLLMTKYTVFWLGGFFIDDDGYNAILFAFIAAALFAIAAFAAFIPALRATRIDPVEALRHE